MVAVITVAIAPVADDRRLRAALLYAKELDWPVAPAHHIRADGQCSCGNPDCNSPGKHPRTQHGFQDATSDPAQIKEWWLQWPDANILVPTSERTGIFVLDIDPGHGGSETLEKLEAEYGSLPVTQEQTTGSGGRHLLFNHPGPVFRNTAGKLGPGIDTRGEGGYIIAAPSNHVSGKCYRWREGRKPNQVPAAAAPEWLLELLRKRNTKCLQPSSRGEATPSAYAEAVLAEEQKLVANAARGTRNEQLNMSAFALGELVGGGQLDQGRVERSLTDAALAAGLHQREIESTLASGLRAGMKNPREIPTDGNQSGATHRRSGTRTRQSSYQERSWQLPVPLPPAIPEAPEMPESLIPPILRPWLCDVCERTQIPLDFTTAPAIVALSSVVGRTVGLYPKQHDDWLCVPNLWGVVIGRPGVLKTPALFEALKPLRYLAHEAQEAHKDNARSAEAKAVVIQARIDSAKAEAKTAAKGSPDDQKLHLAEAKIFKLTAERENSVAHEKRYIVNDGTVEKIGELLNQNPRGLLLVRDELVGLLRTLDKRGHENDRAFYLEAWAGAGEFTYDRIARGTIHVPALTLSIIGGMTPGKLLGYVNGALAAGLDDDGLLQRFQLAVWPEQSTDWKNVDHHPDTVAKETAFEVFRLLDGISADALGAELHENQIPGLRFAPDAQELFNDFREQLERRIRTSEDAAPSFESHIAKYRSLMPSLALVFHLIEAVQSGTTGPVNLQAAKLAARWCDYLEQHARKIYAAELNPDLTAAHLLLNKIRAGAICDGMNIREIYRPQWSGLTRTEVVWAGIQMLNNHKMIRITQKETGGRQADVLEINPEIRQRTA